MLDEALEDRIAEILAPLMKRLRTSTPRRSVRAEPQAGAGARGRHGDRPGRDGSRRGACRARPAIVVLPGPAAGAAADVAGGASPATPSRPRSPAGRDYEQHTLRLFGIPESEIAETLREAETEIEGFDRLEITTCLRRGEVEMVTRVEPDARGRRTRRWSSLRPRAPPARALLERRRERGRPGRGAARRTPHCDGRVVHRRPDGRSPDRSPGVVGLRGRRRGCVRERDEDGPAGVSIQT